MKRIDVKFAFGIFFILISIIGVVCSVCFRKNYILDIVQLGTIGTLLIYYSGKIKQQNKSVIVVCLLLFIISSIMKMLF